MSTCNRKLKIDYELKLSLHFLELNKICAKMKTPGFTSFENSQSFFT